MNWPYLVGFPTVFAHRGAGKLAPENTLAAMRRGWDMGFRAVEFDVMLSKDGVPVLMHDPELGRTVAGSGTVASTLAADLLKMDAGSWFSSAYAGEPVPNYVSVLQFCRAHGIFMNVEIKPSPGVEVETGRIVAAVTQQFFADTAANSSVVQDQPMNYPLFSSFSLQALLAAKAVAPEIPRGYLIDEFIPDWQQQLQKVDAISLHVNHRILNPSFAKQIKQAGYGLFCYTVNELARAREICGWGADAFCTDRLDLIPSDFLGKQL